MRTATRLTHVDRDNGDGAHQHPHKKKAVLAKTNMTMLGKMHKQKEHVVSPIASTAASCNI